MVLPPPILTLINNNHYYLTNKTQTIKGRPISALVITLKRHDIFHFLRQRSSMYNATGNTSARSSSALHWGMGRNIYSSTVKTATMKSISAKRGRERSVSYSRYFTNLSLPSLKTVLYFPIILSALPMSTSTAKSTSTKATKKFSSPSITISLHYCSPLRCRQVSDVRPFAEHRLLYTPVAR